MRKIERYKIFAITFFLLFCVTSVSHASQGYQPRHCGLDMNRNGIIGERQDCQVCNGLQQDPDFDGILEDLIYIDCENGTDDLDCGSPEKPCKTIRFAWMEVADGAEDGAEDILCFRNTCTTEENIAPKVSGVEGTYIKPQSGSEARDWELPKDPTMLIGWDTDRDGKYPPEDRDDIAVLDGGPNQLSMPFYFNSAGVRSFIEIAHFTAKNYGTYHTESTRKGFMQIGKYGTFSTHVYLHDLELIDINRGQPSSSSTIVFNFFRGGTSPRWWFFSNMKITGISSWLARGSGPDIPEKENGPYRFQNLSVEVMGCPHDVCGSQAATTMFKLWGYVAGVEILDSEFDLNPQAWNPGGNPSHGVTPAQCSRDWTIRNNTFIDFQKALHVKGYARGACDGEIARTTDDVVFDRNLVVNLWEWGSYGDPSVQILEGNSPTETVEDVTVTNNIFASAVPLVACLWVNGGNRSGPNPGTITFVGNTCAAPYERYAGIMIGQPGQEEAPFPHESFVIANNLLDRLESGALNAWFEYSPQNLTMNNNVFDPEGGFQWMESKRETLGDWQTLSGVDAASKACTPRYRTRSPGLMRLHSNDRCARNAGTFQPQASPLDIDGDQRGQDGQWDVGADESAPGSSRG